VGLSITFTRASCCHSRRKADSATLLSLLTAYSGHFIDYIMDRDDVKPLWHQHTHHAFVEQLADGTLPLQSFKHYLIQDYHYLVHFARANALAAYKATNMDDINTVCS
jgi:thiaminase